MAKEIERKFLVDKLKLPILDKGSNRDQGYISIDPEVRIIITNENKQISFLSIKGKGTIERDEFEYVIPNDEAHQLFKLSKYKLNKTRYYIKDNEQNLVWEIDEFHKEMSGFWLVEVELKTKDMKIKLPKWLGKEVTSDIRYYNKYLAINGKWWS